MDDIREVYRKYFQCICNCLKYRFLAEYHLFRAKSTKNIFDRIWYTYMLEKDVDFLEGVVKDLEYYRKLVKEFLKN